MQDLDGSIKVKLHMSMQEKKIDRLRVQKSSNIFSTKILKSLFTKQIELTSAIVWIYISKLVMTRALLKNVVHLLKS